MNDHAVVDRKSQESLLTSFWYGIRGRPRTLIRDQLNVIYVVFIPIISAFLIIRVIPILIILAMSFTNYTIRRPALRSSPYFQNLYSASFDLAFSCDLDRELDLYLEPVYTKRTLKFLKHPTPGPSPKERGRGWG